MSSHFLINALKYFKQTGSLCRSSKFLAKKLVKPLNSTTPLTVLELGAGDGIVTKHILRKINKNSELHSYEINQNFVTKLNEIKDHRLVIHNSCVSNLKSVFSESQIDFIVSSLPLANIEYLFKQNLIDDMKHILKPKGILIQYQYFKNDLKLLEYKFSKTTTSLCIKNLPPAFIYNCVNG